MAGGSPVTVLDATDEQFEAFIKQVGIPVKANDEGQRWSFDNRCRAINYALKYRLHLPFVDATNSDTEQKKSRMVPVVTFDELPGPILTGKYVEVSTDEHPLEPIAPSGGRDYPDLEEGE